MKRAWLSLLAVALGVMVVQVDGTVVAIANPAIAADLGAGLDGISWVTTGYLLVLAGLMIPAGTIADKVGYKKAFLVGTAGFALASLLCGLSSSIGMLIGARVLQATFAALLAPAGLAVLRAAFPPEKLSMAFGVFGAVSAVSLAGGPILGGVLVEYASWPWAFFVNLPLGVIAVVVGALVIKDVAPGRSSPLDVPGAVTLTLAMVGVVWAISGVPTHGWGSTRTLGFLAAGLVLLGAFLVIERRTAAPMLPLDLFRDRTFALGIVLIVVTMLAFFAVLFYLTFYLQGVRGNAPIEAAVALLPLTVVFTVASPLAGWLTAKLGVRGTLLLGALVIASALLLFQRLEVDSGLLTLGPPLVLSGFGVGFLLVPAMQATLGTAPIEKSGVASGILQSAQQFGSTLGVAVFGSILGAFVAGRIAQVGAVDPQAVAIGLPPALQSGLSPTVVDAAHALFLDGMHLVFLIGAGVALVAGVLALFVREPKPAAVPDAATEAEPETVLETTPAR
jgi:EmrB/QacA subfamily drug resistance transporter